MTEGFKFPSSIAGNVESEELAILATGRRTPLFSAAVAQFHTELRATIEGRRVLVVGGAGTIGAATTRALVPFRPRAIHVVDQDENALAELIRDFRNRFAADKLPDLRTRPISFGGPAMERLLGEEEPYDYVLNFAALKHVRSEKDCCSVLQMFDTNLVRPVHLLKWLVKRGGVHRYFCVSTDKAANPVNLMGASKRLMEHMVFSDELVSHPGITVTSARFANVAFSNGSLLQSWLIRLARGQPLAVPQDTRRYFVSIEEAGQICLLAAFLGSDRHLLAPQLEPAKDLVDLAQLAAKVLRYFGFEVCLFTDEGAARDAAARRRLDEGYPLLITPLDTSGEKPYEEFVGQGESSVDLAMQHLVGVPYVSGRGDLLRDFLDWLEVVINSAFEPVSKDELVQRVQRVLPEFHHRRSDKSLDQRL